MVPFKGIETEVSRFWFNIPLFHLPILGGWKNYVVLEPYCKAQEWHIGWISEDVSGISRIKVRGPARLLLGPCNVSFFGINTDGYQIAIQKVGEGQIGDRGKYAQTPLL